MRDCQFRDPALARTAIRPAATGPAIRQEELPTYDHLRWQQLLRGCRPVSTRPSSELTANQHVFWCFRYTGTLRRRARPDVPDQGYPAWLDDPAAQRRGIDVPELFRWRGQDARRSS